MRFYFTLPSLLVFAFGVPVVHLLVRAWFRNDAFVRKRSWYAMVRKATLFHVLGTAAAILAFINTYGWITDDVNYFFYPADYVQPWLFSITNANHFMWWVTYPFRRYLLVNDRPTMHVIFGLGGLLASFAYLHVYFQMLGPQANSKSKVQRSAFWALLCFPNFLAWGRFYGKDSLMLMFSALFVVSAWHSMRYRSRFLAGTLGIVASTYLMSRIRPHIAMAFVTAYLTALVFRTVSARSKNAESPAGLLRILIPVLAPAIIFLFATASITRLTGKEDFTFEDAQRTVQESSRMGAYGGSVTDYGLAMREDTDIIFNPLQIAINVFNLLFAPLPWQVRGVAQMIALVANIMLFVFVVRYGRNVFPPRDPWGWFLLFQVFFLSIILSFLTGNMGLLMRQKLIVLPGLFLLLFMPSGKVLE